MSKVEIDKFWESRAKLDDPQMATRFREDNTLFYDLRLVKKYLPQNGRLLDLGCGTCTLTNALASHTSYIRGVDKQVGLMRFCEVGPNFDTVVSDVTEYCDDTKYDVITIIGVINYVLSDEVVEQIYRNAYNMLEDGGYLIVKQQSGVYEDIQIDDYSEELGSNYIALYRHRAKDEMLLSKQGFQVETIDIYPPEINRWENTHHYAYVAKK